VNLITDAGPRPCAVHAPDKRRGLVDVDMGVARLSPARPIGAWEGVPVSMGNPHRVIFVGSEGRRLAVESGEALSVKENANIEFVERRGPNRYAATVWERGAGLTQACGTGACAVAAAAVERGEAKRHEEIVVELPGGSLTIRVDERNRVRMTGPAELVFVGEVPA
jgi:diaminopimelate epimerase